MRRAAVGGDHDAACVGLHWHCALGLPLALGGCVGALVVGGLAAAGEAGYVAAQERGVRRHRDGFRDQDRHREGLHRRRPAAAVRHHDTVYQGRVLLTGQVATPEMKAQAGRSPGAPTTSAPSMTRSSWRRPKASGTSAQDAWISTRVRAEMVADPAIRSVNYTIDTENGSVFLIGSARSQNELDRATRIARYVPGVKRVVSYVELRSGRRRPPAGAAAARRDPSPDAPAGAPRAPVEVQKL